MFCPRFGD